MSEDMPPQMTWPKFVNPWKQMLSLFPGEYERGFVDLRCLIGNDVSEAQLDAIVKRVASESPHGEMKHLAPSHLAYLLKNKWIVEGSPEDHRVEMDRVYPSKCEFECLEKFLALIEEAKK